MQIPDGAVSVRPQVNPGWELSEVEGELAEPYEAHGETVTEGVREVVWSGGNLPDAYLDEFGMSMKLPDGEEPPPPTAPARRAAPCRPVPRMAGSGPVHSPVDQPG